MNNKNENKSRINKSIIKHKEFTYQKIDKNVIISM